MGADEGPTRDDHGIRAHLFLFKPFSSGPPSHPRSRVELVVVLLFSHEKEVPRICGPFVCLLTRPFFHSAAKEYEQVERGVFDSTPHPKLFAVRPSGARCFLFLPARPLFCGWPWLSFPLLPRLSPATPFHELMLNALSRLKTRRTRLFFALADFNFSPRTDDGA